MQTRILEKNCDSKKGGGGVEKKQEKVRCAGISSSALL